MNIKIGTYLFNIVDCHTACLNEKHIKQYIYNYVPQLRFLERMSLYQGIHFPAQYHFAKTFIFRRLIMRSFGKIYSSNFVKHLWVNPQYMYIRIHIIKIL